MNANRPQKHGLTAIDGAMVLIVILLIVQIWLLSATLESYLAGHRDAALPGVKGGVKVVLPHFWWSSSCIKQVGH